MPEPVYLELLDEHGRAPSHKRTDSGLEIPNPRAGDPDTLNNIGIQVQVPVLVDGEIAMTTSRIPIVCANELDEQLAARIIPGTRIVETTNPAVVNVLMQTGHYRQVAPPERKSLSNAEKALARQMLAEGNRVRGEHHDEITAAIAAATLTDTPAPPPPAPDTTSEQPEMGEEG